MARLPGMKGLNKLASNSNSLVMKQAVYLEESSRVGKMATKSTQTNVDKGVAKKVFKDNTSRPSVNPSKEATQRYETNINASVDTALNKQMNASIGPRQTPKNIEGYTPNYQMDDVIDATRVGKARREVDEAFAKGPTWRGEVSGGGKWDATKAWIKDNPKKSIAVGAAAVGGGIIAGNVLGNSNDRRR